MEIAAIGFPETMLGFKLSGVRVTADCTKENADSKLVGLMESESVGLIILDQDLLSFLSLKTKKRIEASTKPVIVTIPGKTGAVAGGESISMMVKRAIGVDLSSKGK
ncbi:MAG: V-type ATP synthase subunit F [Candidatus Micrarchaeota archaeon]